MLRMFVATGLGLWLLSPSPAFALCQTFTGSTMDVAGVQRASWRTDYPPPPTAASVSFGDFAGKPKDYMVAVLDTVKPYFRRDGKKLVGTGQEPWWMSLWLDYSTSGREPLMGLTKERGPNPGDLSPTNGNGYQVWAVGFYNAPGASVFGSVFAKPCEPVLPASVGFPDGTVSVKFLFTDASPNEVTYLKDAPTYEALIDAAGAGSGSRPVDQRTKRELRLLQVDISIKDKNASLTGWVFGTFGWVGPPKGDALYDNLVPVSLQWGNDRQEYGTNIKQSWINPDLTGVMFGWPQRPSLGFQGRANGPADNIRSSCLSCHAAARTPRSSKGLLGFGFNMNTDIHDAAKVKAHVDLWFDDIKGGDLFDPGEPAVSALDYSLQIEAAVSRMCLACKNGALSGSTPVVCRDAKFYTAPNCGPAIVPFDVKSRRLREQSEEVAPPRQ